MKKETRNIVYKNRFTLLSLVIILAMFVIYQIAYDPAHPARKVGAAVTSTGAPPIGGAFQLTDHTGAPFTQADLAGQYSLIYFGFTFCPDICPMSLSVITEAYDQLTPAQQAMLTPVFITVDPARDTVPVMAEYVAAFHEDMVGLTGTPQQIKDAAGKYLVYYAKNEKGAPEGGAGDAAAEYLMDHSGYTYFMGPDGSYITHFSTHDTAADILPTMQKYLHK